MSCAAYDDDACQRSGNVRSDPRVSDLYANASACPPELPSTPPVRRTLAAFQRAFDVYTRGVFRGFPWAKLGAVVAGEAVVASLLSEGETDEEIEASIQKQGFDLTPIDLYIIVNPKVTERADLVLTRSCVWAVCVWPLIVRC